MIKKTLTIILFCAVASSSIYANELTILPYEQNASKIIKMHHDFTNTKFDKISSTTRSSGANIYTKVLPSVVKIITNEGHGTGVLISTIDNGIILTNNHVIENYNSVGIIFASDKEDSKLSIGTVIKIDQVSDLALVKLNILRNDLVPLAISDNEGVIGSDVHAIGHPLGEDWTYTRGYISQLRKNYSWQTGLNQHHAADIIQTQTPINPGNSGGPLLNENGELIGINSFVNQNAQGLNYAVSITSILEFFNADGDVLKKAMPQNSKSFGQLINSLDENTNGTPETYFYDNSSNNVVDILVGDTDEDLVADIIMWDDDENSIYETRVTYIEIDGQEIAFYELDENQDGTAELRAIDYDMDGNIDVVEPID